MIGKIPFGAALIGAGTALALALGPANAQDTKKQIEALEKRVAELEGKTSVTISGYVKGDFYIDSDIDLGNTFGNAAGVKLDGAEVDDDDGAVGAHAGQSRVRLSSSTDTPYGALNTVVEAGFNPYDDTHKLRLRLGLWRARPGAGGTGLVDSRRRSHLCRHGRIRRAGGGCRHTQRSSA